MEDFIKLAAIAGTALGTVIGAWLHARFGRKVRLKIGDIEAESQTVDEVKKLIAYAMETQQVNQPKVIKRAVSRPSPETRRGPCIAISESRAGGTARRTAKCRRECEQARKEEGGGEEE